MTSQERDSLLQSQSFSNLQIDTRACRACFIQLGRARARGSDSRPPDAGKSCTSGSGPSYRLEKETSGRVTPV
jgi:hypothetical protein